MNYLREKIRAAWNWITSRVKTALASVGAVLGIGAISIAQVGGGFPKDVTLSYTQPTQYEDGALIEPGDLVSNRFLCTWSDGTVLISESRPVTAGPGLQQTEVFVGVVTHSGTYSCNAFVSTADEESGPSNTAIKKVTGKPNPVNDLAITGD